MDIENKLKKHLHTGLATKINQSKNKKILMVSQFQSSSENYCYAEFLSKLALKNNFEVEKFDCKKNYFYFGPKSSDLLPLPLKWISNLISNISFAFKVLKTQPNLVFFVKGENINFRLLKFLKKAFKFKLINFYPDSPFSLWNANSSYNIIRALPLYDRFAIWSKLLAKVLLSSGGHQVFYWPFVCDKDVFKPAALSDEFELAEERFLSDVCFVGSWDKKREQYLTDLMTKEPTLELKIWGEGWAQNLHKGSILTGCVKGGALTPENMCRAFSFAKIVVNFLRDQNYTSHNMRTFEAASCQAFLLTERSEEQAKELFVEDTSVACFSGPDEMHKKIIYFLALDLLRKKIAKAGKERCSEMFEAEEMFKNLTSF